jgi:hypothetical protein
MSNPLAPNEPLVSTPSSTSLSDTSLEFTTNTDRLTKLEQEVNLLQKRMLVLADAVQAIVNRLTLSNIETNKNLDQTQDLLVKEIMTTARRYQDLDMAVSKITVKVNQ